jgi:hypothetical protein
MLCATVLCNSFHNLGFWVLDPSCFGSLLNVAIADSSCSGNISSVAIALMLPLQWQIFHVLELNLQLQILHILLLYLLLQLHILSALEL